MKLHLKKKSGWKQTCSEIKFQMLEVIQEEGKEFPSLWQCLHIHIVPDPIFVPRWRTWFWILVLYQIGTGSTYIKIAESEPPRDKTNKMACAPRED